MFRDKGMTLRTGVMLFTAVLIAGCLADGGSAYACPGPAAPPGNVNQQVQFNDDGVMYQGQAFAETAQEAQARAKYAAERARRDALDKGGAYGQYADCVSQGLSVTIQDAGAAGRGASTADEGR